MHTITQSEPAEPAVGFPLERRVGRLVNEDKEGRAMTHLCTWPACKTAGCVDCNEAVEMPDDDERAEAYADEDREPPEFGCCLPPGECCMPGLHFPSECHTAADYERQHGVDWRKTPNVGNEGRASVPLD